jgi:hypothetical protein
VKKQKQTGVVEEKSETAPIWIISFADMISLMMAFFVLLLTMTTARSGKLCNEGEGIFEQTLYGFRRTIEGLGIPEIFGGIPGMLGGADNILNFDSRKVYYPISDGNDTTDGRTIDAREERVRRIFSWLEKRTKTFRSQIVGRQPDYVLLPVTFGQGQFVLDNNAKQHLARFAADLQQLSGSHRPDLYVVGFAEGEPDKKQQWILSARRAQAVANFLQSCLPAGGSWPIYCWGAGAGGDWASSKGPVSKGVEILIAVLSVNN